MQIIKIHHPLDSSVVPAGSVVLAMGFFDGVHRGHQAVIRKAKEIARQKGLPLAVLTYDHLPKIVYRQYPVGGVHYLTPLPRKMELFEQLGVDRVYLTNLTSALSALSPQEFVDQYLAGFHAQVVVAGFDHTYGSDTSKANMAHLSEYAKGRFEVVTIDKQTLTDNHKVGSTKIRQLLDQGDVQQANEQLGYYYTTSGVVVHGFARGRTLGFPTANIAWPQLEWLPAVGVYAVQLRIGDQWYDGMASVGNNVTFGDNYAKTLEINLFDFHQEIYGENVKVRWVKHLRGEVKFNGADELVAQLKRDRQHAKLILNDLQPLPEQLLH